MGGILQLFSIREVSISLEFSYHSGSSCFVRDKNLSEVLSIRKILSFSFFSHTSISPLTEHILPK